MDYYGSFEDYQPSSNYKKQQEEAKRRREAYEEQQQRMKSYMRSVGETPDYDPWSGSYF